MGSVRVKSRPTDFALIIGAMKSGTTTLFDLLAQHPDVAACLEKEPSFFSEDRTEAEWEGYLDLWEWNAEAHKIAVEASTSYAKAPWIQGVPRRIAARSQCRFRFIYLMRDPVTRIASQVRHGLYDGWGRSLDDGISDDLIDFSRYAMQLDQYLDFFPRESFLLITLEALSTEPDAVLARVCDFLGISRDHEFVGKTEARNRGDFYDVPRIVSWLAKTRVGRGVVRRLPSGLHQGLRNALSRLGSRSKSARGRWQLNDQERREVLLILASDLQRLQDEYGVDVTRHWSTLDALPTS
jgi:hypothetical protein